MYLFIYKNEEYNSYILLVFKKFVIKQNDILISTYSVNILPCFSNYNSQCLY